jgi:hypothetical protein
MSFADVAEGVRATIAAYTQALDDGRVDDVVATFAADGSVDLPGLGAHTGHDELRAAFEKVVPQVPQRHLVLNTHVSDWSDSEARASSDVVFLVRGDAGWMLVLVGRYHDVLRRDGDTWLFRSRVADFIF